jgi:S-formylglutathione hydrolase FrmB
VNLYITAGTGGSGLAQQAAGPGGMLESVVADCTRELQARTEQLGIPATFSYLPGGEHAWPYWQQALHAAWPGFARSLAD